MAHRYFTTDIADGRAVITGDDAVHLARVLRTKPGDALLLCDGAGTDYDAVVETAGPGRVELKVLAARPTGAEPTIRVQVYLGVAKGERMDIAVQKCVELGAYSITPFYSATTVVKPKKDDGKTQRWNRIAAEAAKQCGRGILPTVTPPVPFAEALALAASCEKALFFYEKGGVPLRGAVGSAKTLAIITGPEGGFTGPEAQAAADAGCLTVGLGPRILRCETAPAAVLAAIMCESGNLE